ncbi:DUF6950 family protein [Sphingomonas sp. Ag1]|uniref:DUF6950 family protein n=1 Tax=Sphingomonas sp. Ag1 TaxID=1642949 RepID=UPI00062211F8|nr:hypothetical protein [Sphingomonas sp. Ag1]KKI17501.1 hypothetical protein XM50_14435 [Sphingomonas sp. Ag1]
MHRYPDWDARLAAYLEPLRLRPFAWGKHDCCIFAAGAVEAMTGVDPMPEFRGRYTTAIGSARALRRFGRGDLAATLDGKFEPVPAALAQRGDIVMSSGLLGICWGPFLFAVGSEGDREGLVRIDRRAWVEPRAWRVAYGF